MIQVFCFSFLMIIMEKATFQQRCSDVLQFFFSCSLLEVLFQLFSPLQKLILLCHCIYVCANWCGCPFFVGFLETKRRIQHMWFCMYQGSSHKLCSPCCFQRNEVSPSESCNLPAILKDMESKIPPLSETWPKKTFKTRNNLIILNFVMVL